LQSSIPTVNYERNRALSLLLGLNGDRLTVHTYRITGSFQEHKRTSNFCKEIRAVKKEDAIERIYSELGSNRRLKRRSIRIETVEIVPPEESLADSDLQALREEEKPRIFIH